MVVRLLLLLVCSDEVLPCFAMFISPICVGWLLSLPLLLLPEFEQTVSLLALISRFPSDLPQFLAVVGASDDVEIGFDLALPIERGFFVARFFRLECLERV